MRGADDHRLLPALTRAASDSVFQMAATSGVRLGVVASVPILSLVVVAADVARFDLFLVGSNLLMIVLTLGVDSGLATVSNMQSSRRRTNSLMAGLLIVCCMSTALLIPAYIFATLVAGSSASLADYGMAYAYSVSNAATLVVFSFFRWLGQATIASIAIIVANGLGLAAAYILLRTGQGVEGFMLGVTCGGMVSALICLCLARSILIPRGGRLRIRYQFQLSIRILRVSMPFAVASFVLLSRRLVDRAIILSFGGVALLGAYATVLRTGEILAFALTVPSLGLSPMIVRHCREALGVRLARVTYGGYMVAAILCTIAAMSAWLWIGRSIFPAEAQPISPLFVPTIAGTLILSQTAVAGYGFIIRADTRLVAWLSAGFIATYILIAAPFYLAGQMIFAVGAGFVVSSLLHSMLFIWLSERRHSFGYSLRWATIANVMLAAMAVASMILS